MTCIARNLNKSIAYPKNKITANVNIDYKKNIDKSTKHSMALFFT